MSSEISRETGMQTNVYDCLQKNTSDIYETIKRSNSTQKVSGKRCKFISCKNVCLFFLTAAAIGTLTGLVFLFFSYRTTTDDIGEKLKELEAKIKEFESTDEEKRTPTTDTVTTTTTTTLEPTTPLPCCDVSYDYNKDGYDSSVYGNYEYFASGLGRTSEVDCIPCVNTTDTSEDELEYGGDYSSGYGNYHDDDFDGVFG